MTTQIRHTEHTARCWWNHNEARWICAKGRTEARQLVDVRDMIVVHTALRRELRMAAEAVARIAAGATKAVGFIDSHVAFLCDLLHHHHHGEDTLLWPILRERVPAVSTLIDQVEAQHSEIDAALAAVSHARATWQAKPDGHNRDELVVTLRALAKLVDAHLDLEETALLPVAATNLTEEEWAAIGAAGAATTPKSAMMLVFGMFAHEGDPEVLRAMLAPAPAVLRFLVPRLAPRVYARHQRRLGIVVE